ncbi:MAG: acyl transferase [Bacteroidetes bacterium]|nr:acyl transferase [Bacteroidota bacterium]
MSTEFTNIFSITSNEDFENIVFKAFYYQLANNLVYKQYVDLFNINKDEIKHSSQIPCLPIEFFKTHRICTSEKEEIIFTSSGTTGTKTSKHYVSDLNLYIESFTKGFHHFYGDIKEYCIVALLPSYLEREGSSLVLMAEHLIKDSQHPKSNFYLNNLDELIIVLNELKQEKQKTILLGVSYALLDLAEKGITLSDNIIVMETGGMKGKRREMIKEELHKTLCDAFKINYIHSEYGMTELLSQAYSKGKGIYETPAWMQINVRDVNDPLTILAEQKSGGINIIDLANWYSCPFIATQDLGKKLNENQFEILGRFDNSDVRGCNLLVG